MSDALAAAGVATQEPSEGQESPEIELSLEERSTPVIDEAALAEVAKRVIDRRPYSDEARSEIRGLENAIAREVVAWLKDGAK